MIKKLFITLLLIAGITAAIHYTQSRDNQKPVITPYPVKGIAVLGDSQSDEYRGDDNRAYTRASTTLNWVELLASYRNLSFGEWGERPEPRRKGYEFVWARTGANAESLINQGQHIGVAEQIKKGAVNVVIIYIGANDFAPHLSDMYQRIYDGSLAGNELDTRLATMATHLEKIVQTVQQAGDSRIFLIKIPDWSKHLALQIAFPHPLHRGRVSDAIRDTNARLDKITQVYTLETIDPNPFYDSILQNRNGAEVMINGKGFNRLIPSDEPYSIFLSDGIHPGTVFNGLFANWIMQHFNQTLGTRMKEFTYGEIFQYAGIQ